LYFYLLRTIPDTTCHLSVEGATHDAVRFTGQISNYRFVDSTLESHQRSVQARQIIFNLISQ